MRQYCTLSDKNFLPKGLALYRALKKHSSEEFDLHYLCLDDESFVTLKDLSLPGLSPHSLQVLEAMSEDLQKAKQNRPYNEYCWTLASYFLNNLMETENLPDLTYIDSDICFYADPKIFFDEVGSKSVGIIAHRHNAVGDRDGAYNVGVVYFKSDVTGRECLSWWADAVLNKKYPELQTCGDQKYLEEFIPRFGADNVCVADTMFGHGAPWNYRLYCWDEFDKGVIRWGDKRQTFLFNHFSRMSYDLSTGQINPTSGKYMDHTLGGAVFNIPQVMGLYGDYFKELKEIHETWLVPKAPSFIKHLKMAFGMIVLNGDFVLKQVLDSVYDTASQILVAEGPVKWWQDLGIKTSMDRTNNILDNYPDPKNKLRITHGMYPEKDEQANAYIKSLDPDTDYIINLDSDEVWKPEDLEKIMRLLRDHQYTSIGVRSCTFYGGFDRYITGWEQKKDQFLRVFKTYPGCYWLTHRPPTITAPQGTRMLPAKHLDSDALFDETGVQLYHMSYVFPRQVKNKVAYYKHSLAKDKVIDDYYNSVYLPWMLGDDQKKAIIENTHQGVHEWKPGYRGPAFTTPFTGSLPKVFTPDIIDNLRIELSIELGIETGTGIFGI